MNRTLALLLFTISSIAFAQAPQLKSGSTVYIEPMGGYETYGPIHAGPFDGAQFARSGCPLLHHVTETHVAAGFGKFVEYQTRNVAEGLATAFPQASEAVQ